MQLHRVGELALLKAVRKRFNTALQRDRSVLVPIGDDAAVFAPEASRLVVTTDLMAEGVHFDLAYTSPYALGFKLVSVNVSDVMAMGVRARYLLLNVGMKQESDEAFFEEFYDGIAAACEYYRISLIGGDMSGVRNDLFLSATVIGEGETFVTRRGARPGDRIYVTGTLGDSACGLALLKLLSAAGRALVRRRISGMTPHSGGGEALRVNEKTLSWEVADPVLRRHLLPLARPSESIAPCATAMIDVSDGLFIDLSRLCDESGVGATIYMDRLPRSTAMVQVGALLGCDTIAWAASGGEDYELLFTAPELPDANPAETEGIPVTCIGEITGGDRIVVGVDGMQSPLQPTGYEHFIRNGEQ